MLSQINSVIFCTTQIMQVVIFVAGCYFFGISIFGWRKRKEKNPGEWLPQKKFALVVAAHNEETVIAHIVDSLNRQNYPGNLFDVFVIADNCTDRTAEIAEEHGAKVYKRFNNEARGKGHAIEWMFAKIFNMKEKYDAICVFDADNLVTSNYLLEMNRQLCEGHKVVQGYIDSKTLLILGLPAHIPLLFGFQTDCSSFPDTTWDLAAVFAVQAFVLMLRF